MKLLNAERRKTTNLPSCKRKLTIGTSVWFYIRVFNMLAHSIFTRQLPLTTWDMPFKMLFPRKAFTTVGAEDHVDNRMMSDTHEKYDLWISPHSTIKVTT